MSFGNSKANTEPDPSGRVVLYKIGGSLLDLPDLPRRLLAVIDSSRPLLLVGGGTAADLVRSWDRIHQLNEDRSHALAVEAMRLNAMLLATILPRASIANSLDTAEKAWAAGRIAVLDPIACLESIEESTGERIERSWNVTSDSIAAHLAIHWSAELVMLKSVNRPASFDESDTVDPRFASLVSRLVRVDWINLRDASTYTRG